MSEGLVDNRQRAITAARFRVARFMVSQTLNSTNHAKDSII